MNRIIPLLALLALCLASPALAAMPVTVSIVPQKYFVEQIGGDLVDVSVMVQPGASPASYEPKPRQMAQLSKARIYFSIGVPFEAAWLDRIRSANEDMSVIAMDENIDKLPMAEHHHHEEQATEEHGDHHHAHEGHHEEHGHDHAGEHHGHNGIPDPHVWTAPPLVRVMAGTIRDALINEDPQNQSVYEANYETFVKKIDSVDAKLRAIFKDVGLHNRFMVYHPSWGYFAKTYGLTQIPIELEGKQPGPRELAELIQHAKQEGIRVIFVQPQFSEKSAQLIAKAINGSVIKADPLAYDWPENLLKVGKGFKDALK